MSTINKTAASDAKPAKAAPKKTKTALLVELLQRPGGSTMAELAAETRWQQHTVRAALTGLRKKGHDVTKGTRDNATCYSIAATEA